MGILGKTINCIWWWGSNSGALKSYLFIAIILGPLWVVMPVRVPSMDQVWKVLLLGRNISNHITVCNWFDWFDLVFVLMVYQPSWVIQCQRYSWRRTIVVVFNLLFQFNSLKVTIIAWIEFELVHNDATAQYINHDDMTSGQIICIKIVIWSYDGLQRIIIISNIKLCNC